MMEPESLALTAHGLFYILFIQLGVGLMIPGHSRICCVEKKKIPIETTVIFMWTGSITTQVSCKSLYERSLYFAKVLNFV